MRIVQPGEEFHLKLKNGKVVSRKILKLVTRQGITYIQYNTSDERLCGLELEAEYFHFVNNAGIREINLKREWNKILTKRKMWQKAIIRSQLPKRWKQAKDGFNGH